MESISYSLASANAIKSFIHSEVKRPDNKVQNGDEASQSQAAKATTMAAIKSIRSMVDDTLTKLRSEREAHNQSREKTYPFKDVKHLEKLAPGNVRISAAKELPPAAENLKKSMSPDEKEGLGSQTKSLQEMANSAEPIVNNFDAVLTKPYLNHFSATLNTVPVVGLKNNQIMYLATVPDMFAEQGFKEVWTFFSDLPVGANITEGSSVCFFPFKGDFCLSIGTAVWRKRHRSEDDPALSQAVDNWPKMYLNEWGKIGDKVLPAADLKSVIPFAVLSGDRNAIGFQLLILDKDGALQMLNNDDLYPSTTWTTLTYQAGAKDPKEAPKWTAMAYWNDLVVALDAESNMWDLTIDFQAHAFSVSNKTPIEPASQLTATDVGPVTVRADGYLYKRYVEDPPSGGDEPVAKWKKWLLADGITHLGVASPGVLLNLDTLTRTLKSRYLDTQTALYPVVSKIRAWAITHQSYLTLLMKAAADYEAATGSKAEAIAITNGKAYVAHAKVWAQLLNGIIGRTKETVNIMTAQLHGVKTQLEVQLQLLKDKLVGLEATLKSQKEALNKLQAAFWGAVAAMLLGLALGVLAVASGVGAVFVIGAGALFVAGLVAAIVLTVKIQELNQQISNTDSQIRTTKQAIEELTTITKSFTDIDSMYKDLNVFWGRVKVDAEALKDMDDATALQLGEDILIDTSSIVAAQGITEEIKGAAQLYLDVLAKQGIRIDDAAVTSKLDGKQTEASSSRPHAVALAHFQRAVDDGTSRLSQNDFEGYIQHMNRALHFEVTQPVGLSEAQFNSGMWYDVSALSKAAPMFNPNSLEPTSSALLSGSDINPKSLEPTSPALLSNFGISEQEVRNRINTSAPVVVDLLKQTVSTCQTIQDLIQRYKKLEAEGDMKGIAELRGTLLAKALEECSSAQKNAAKSNNAFVEVNRSCTEYQQGLEREQIRMRDEETAARNTANYDLSHIDIPWYVYLGGAGAVLAYVAKTTNEIKARLESTLGNLSSGIQALNRLRQSGVTVEGESATWVKMAQTVSKGLADVYNILVAVEGQVLEDPKKYEILMTTEWAEVEKSSREVLSILEAQGIRGNQTMSKKAMNGGAVNGDTKRHAATDQLKSPPTDSKFVNALSASSKLNTSMNDQAKGANTFFDQVQLLMELPYLSGIIGYWDEKQTEKTSLLDVISRFRDQYVDMMSHQYVAVETLYSMSLLQKTRAKMVLEGKLKLDIMVKSSLKSAQIGQQVAQRVNKQFGDSATQYEMVMKQIEYNIGQIKEQMKAIDVNLGDLEKKQQQQIIWIVADVIALSFATAILLVSLGVFGPVAVALTTAAALGLGATATAASIKIVLDSMSLADVTKLISQLQQTKKDLDASVQSLQKVQPIFAGVVDGVDLMAGATSDMADGLSEIIQDLSRGEVFSVTDEDVVKIGASWEDIQNASLAWMDVVNGQGIKPTRF